MAEDNYNKLRNISLLLNNEIDRDEKESGDADLSPFLGTEDSYLLKRLCLEKRPTIFPTNSFRNSKVDLNQNKLKN